MRTAKPMALQILAGNNTRMTKEEIERRTSAENLLKVAKNKLKPPNWLGKIAKKEFKFIVDETKDIELLSNLDIHTLSVYCNLYEQYVNMNKIILEDGIMVAANKSSEAVITSHPLFIRQNQTIEQMRKLQTELGLSPSARAKISLNKVNVEKPKDTIEERFGNL